MKRPRKLPRAVDLRKYMAQHIPPDAVPVALVDGEAYRVVEVRAVHERVTVPGFRLPKPVVTFVLEKL